MPLAQRLRRLTRGETATSEKTAVTPPPTSVRVQLAERSYDIQIGAGLLGRLGTFVAERMKCSHAVVISDSSVAGSIGAGAAESLVAAGARVTSLVVPSGETSKSAARALELWQAMLAERTDRASVVVAVGGGVVGDLAGFVAATFARGLSFVQVPTTLLAMVDSSVGGKVGINLPAAKNMVGGFWQPRGVLIDLNTLATLPRREYLSGLAEVVKYGVILDATLFEYLETHAAAILDRDEGALAHIVARSCQLKADVVQADEREVTGRRAVLNYGHTFAHAIESVCGYGMLLHGEAVAIGMQCAARLAEKLRRIDRSIVERQQRLLQRLELPTQTPAVDHAALLAAMQRDKKVEHGLLRFVLPARLGLVELVDGVPSHLAAAALEDA